MGERSPIHSQTPAHAVYDNGWWYVREINRASHNDYLRDSLGRGIRFSSKDSAESAAIAAGYEVFHG